jgi:hypothetical protein
MADFQQSQQQFLKSFWQWRSGLPSDQRWMADAMAWSATRSGDVQAYQADFSWDQIQSWLADQNAAFFQDSSWNWQADASWQLS